MKNVSFVMSLCKACHAEQCARFVWYVTCTTQPRSWLYKVCTWKEVVIFEGIYKAEVVVL